MLFARVCSLRTGPEELESLIQELRPIRLTGLLKVVFDACDGIIALDRGVIVEAYEIFNDELLVKDRKGRHIAERYRVEPGRIDIYELRSEVLHTFLNTLEESLPSDFTQWFSSLCNNNKGVSSFS